MNMYNINNENVSECFLTQYSKCFCVPNGIVVFARVPIVMALLIPIFVVVVGD
jgi:hypothetical protein